MSYIRLKIKIFITKIIGLVFIFRDMKYISLNEILSGGPALTVVHSAPLPWSSFSLFARASRYLRASFSLECFGPDWLVSKCARG
ncbi:protein of unknown function [Denitratisoma oestradiolicum]|uniref:Uncharacterized protein n=1 Tax=Denitratisoma oestradiolicum TaxID=311182 RepID=A0A6S6XUH3_9PROT|nr:protein of unknown function [Denitratisoma oestradiolicum]